MNQTGTSLQAVEPMKPSSDRYSNQTFYSCDGGYEYVEPGKSDSNSLNTIVHSESEPQDSECFKVFQEKYKAEIEAQMVDEMGKSERNACDRSTFDSLDPEVRKYLVFDQDSGQIFDISKNEVVTGSIQLAKSMKFDVKSAWKNFWKQSSQLNEALLDAAEMGDEKAIIHLLQTSKKTYYINVNAQGLDDWTALHFACDEVNLNIVVLLLQHKANVNMKTNFHRTPLHMAVMRGAFEISKLLVAEGAEVDVPDKEYQTALHMASQQGHETIVLLLLENKADPSSKNHQNATAIDLAQNARVLKVFQQFGISESNNYKRSFIPGTDTLMQNSRNDHITKLLQRTQRVSAPVEAKTPPMPKRNKFEIINLQFTQVTIEKNETHVGKIGPEFFTFYQLLGKGSFGEVYLVEKNNGAHKQYAMKILKKDRMISQNLMKYAQTEKDVLSIMSHPFIVRLNFAFQTETKLFLVMDFCPGGDLSNLLDAKRKLPEDVAKIYVAEILLALETLHKNNIIYRYPLQIDHSDLKPENVVLDSEGHAMLTDFGLSKKGVQDGVLNKSFCGSPAYLPPEILSRQGHSRQVDWYLLGVMTYELLVGIPPYYANERDQLFENIKKGPLKMPRSLSPEAKDFIVSLLNRDPYKRLGAKRDGEEIREHAWLREINWQDCFNRKLKPPKPEPRQFSKTPISVKFPENESNRNKQDGWTFIES